MNVLSIDFDFFIRENYLWDFGHGEAESIYYEFAWLRRYRTIDLHNETRIKKYADFNPLSAYDYLTKKHFSIKENFTLGIADSHRFAYNFFRKNSIDTLYHFDAHSDLYKEDGITCGNWLDILRREKRVKHICWIYPKWLERPVNTYGENVKIINMDELRSIKNMPIDKVFICRSGVWVPPHHDMSFVHMLGSFHDMTKNMKSYEDIPLRSYIPKGKAKQLLKEFQEEMRVRNGNIAVR